MIALGLGTGMRQGELLALRWEDVDLIAGRLMVRRAVARGIIGTPKSGKSREIPLNAKVMRALKAHRHLRGELVFCDSAGKMLPKGVCRWVVAPVYPLVRIGSCAYMGAPVVAPPLEPLGSAVPPEPHQPASCSRARA